MFRGGWQQGHGHSWGGSQRAAAAAWTQGALCDVVSEGDVEAGTRHWAQGGRRGLEKTSDVLGAVLREIPAQCPSFPTGTPRSRAC